MTVVAELRFETLDPAAELAAILSLGEGAVVSFVGVARPHSHEGKVLEQLVLEHHDRLTQISLEEIAADAARRFDVRHIRVVHRCGVMTPGEAIVFAAAASPHRRAAFEAADYLMDRLKTEAIFWKREEGPESSTWIEPTQAVYAARGRWE